MQSNLSKHLINFVNVHVNTNKMMACVILNKKNINILKIVIIAKLVYVVNYKSLIIVSKMKSEIPVVRQKNNLVHGVKFN
jgi:hypothetical protein